MKTDDFDLKVAGEKRKSQFFLFIARVGDQKAKVFAEAGL